MLVSFAFERPQIRNKRALLEDNIGVCLLDMVSHKSSLQMEISNDISDEFDIQRLVIYDEENGPIAFTIISEIDINEISLSFKIGYMDYDHL